MSNFAKFSVHAIYGSGFRYSRFYIPRAHLSLSPAQTASRSVHAFLPASAVSAINGQTDRQTDRRTDQGKCDICSRTASCRTKTCTYHAHDASTVFRTLSYIIYGVSLAGACYRRRWYLDGRPSLDGYNILVMVCNTPTRSTQPCISPWSLNLVQASIGVKR